MDFVVCLHLVAKQVKIHYLGHNDNVSIIEEMKLLKSTKITVLYLLDTNKKWINCEQT